LVKDGGAAAPGLVRVFIGSEHRPRTLMSEFERRVPRREIARVAFIDEDEGTVYLELEPHSGWFITLQEGDVSDFAVGSVVFLDWDGYEIELAPEELWPEPTWLGVVELKG
jgi:catechol 2,3-dioxygenase-like lactoylglutathione lyase family enzyme